MAKILKCDDCGSIIQVLAEGDEKVCSDHMLEFPVQTEGEKSPKHKPVVEIDGDKVSIKLDEITRFDQKSYMDVTFARFRISKDIWDNMDYEKVEFVDEFEKKVEEPAEEEAEE